MSKLVKPKEKIELNFDSRTLDEIGILDKVLSRKFKIPQPLSTVANRWGDEQGRIYLWPKPNSRKPEVVVFLNENHLPAISLETLRRWVKELSAFERKYVKPVKKTKTKSVKGVKRGK